MVDRAPDAARYRAFLSYSHKDAAAAGRLHRRLETYRLPKRLVGTETARGPVPERLAPIFRDRDELPAATDLSETVRAALAESGALIILCSPAAAASFWVAEEIRTFRALHPDRPILAAIVDGEPADCFPESLRTSGPGGGRIEPLATDLRPQGDGKHLGLLKLVAGITGVPLDALVQRDAARRVRRVMAVTAAAVVAMLMMAALTLVALDARREAELQRAEVEHQRAEAEGLIEFMLTDLRSRLKTVVGQLDVTTAVNRRALAYYGGQTRLDWLTSESLERRARILHAMGEDDIARGNLALALDAFREAHRSTASLLARTPNDHRRIFTHGQSEYWVGRVHELKKDWPHARLQYERYAAAAKRLIEFAPTNPDYMLEMAWGASNRGVIQRDGDSNPGAAQISFQEAVHWFARAIEARPRDADARDLANAYGDLSDTFYVRGLWRPALAERLKAYRIYERQYRSNPSNVESIYRLAIAERSVARLFARVGDEKKVQPFLMKAHERARWLTARDPSNTEWLLFRTKVECDRLEQTSVHAGVPEEPLRRKITLAARALADQGNPRISEIQRCLARI